METRLLNNSDVKRYMVTTNQKPLNIFNSLCEIFNLDRSDVVNALVRNWILENTEPDLHDHINKAISPARYTQI